MPYIYIYPFQPLHVYHVKFPIYVNCEKYCCLFSVCHVNSWQAFMKHSCSLA